jgi:hypothetical protein
MKTAILCVRRANELSKLGQDAIAEDRYCCNLDRSRQRIAGPRHVEPRRLICTSIARTWRSTHAALAVFAVCNRHLSRLHSYGDSAEQIELVLFCSQLQLFRASLSNDFGKGLLIAGFRHTKTPLFKSVSPVEPAATENRVEGLRRTSPVEHSIVRVYARACDQRQPEDPFEVLRLHTCCHTATQP